MHLDSIPSHHRSHQCPGYSRDPRFGRTNGHSTCFVQSIIRVWYHSKSPRDLYVFIVGPLLRSEDTHDQPERQPAHHTIIDNLTTNYRQSVEDICIPMITRFDRLMFVFKDLSDFKHRIFRNSNAKNNEISQETWSAGSVTSSDHKQLSKIMKWRHIVK